MKQQTAALAGVSILTFMGFLDFTIVATALPTLQQSLHAHLASLQWVCNIFLLGLMMTMILAGHLGDALGHNRVFFSWIRAVFVGLLWCWVFSDH